MEVSNVTQAYVPKRTHPGTSNLERKLIQSRLTCPSVGTREQEIQECIVL